MKNNKATYFWLALLIVIWGTITVKVYKHISSKKGTEKFIVPELSNNGKIKETNSDIVLKLDYSDPFLKYTVKTTPNKAQNSERNVNTNIRRRIDELNRPVKQLVQWPAIQYSGLIRNNQSQTAVGLLNINGNPYLVREGDKKVDILVKKVFADSIIISFQDESKSILKEN